MSEQPPMDRTDLPPAAQRALPEEYGGRDGPEPVRYGDYEKNGLAVDF